MGSDRQRLASIDILRGMVIVLMAIDHIRDFWAPTQFQPEDLSQTSVALFLTRWITHFCAPVFVFLAGTAAWLYGEQRSPRELSRFLFTRGVWLIMVELLLINPSWQFGLSFVFIQVIWAIGVSMVVLALLVRLPWWLIVAFSVIMIAGHNLLDAFSADQFGDWAWLWAVLHEQRWIPVGDSGVYVLYPLVPWIGVMGAGYALGPVFRMEQGQRHRMLYGLGVALIVAYVLLRLTNVYGDPSTWAPQDRGAVYTLLSFLNTTKYPASLLFLCMTLGPALLVLPWLERWQGAGARVLLVFGQVPFFFYVIHVPVIHALARIRNELVYDRDFGYFASGDWPAAYEPQTWTIYGVWVLILFMLYWPCRWYRDLKLRTRHPALSYI